MKIYSIFIINYAPGSTDVDMKAQAAAAKIVYDIAAISRGIYIAHACSSVFGWYVGSRQRPFNPRRCTQYSGTRGGFSKVACISEYPLMIGSIQLQGEQAKEDKTERAGVRNTRSALSEVCSVASRGGLSAY